MILSISFFIIKINIFRGDLSDISAKTASLVHMYWTQAQVLSRNFVLAHISVTTQTI